VNGYNQHILLLFGQMYGLHEETMKDSGIYQRQKIELLAPGPASKPTESPLKTKSGTWNVDSAHFQTRAQTAYDTLDVVEEEDEDDEDDSVVRGNFDSIYGDTEFIVEGASCCVRLCSFVLFSVVVLLLSTLFTITLIYHS